MPTLRDTANNHPLRGKSQYTAAEREAIVGELNAMMDEGFSFHSACKALRVAHSTARRWGVKRTGGTRNAAWKTKAYKPSHPRFWICMAYYGMAREYDEEYAT